MMVMKCLGCCRKYWLIAWRVKSLENNAATIPFDQNQRIKHEEVLPFHMLIRLLTSTPEVEDIYQGRRKTLTKYSLEYVVKIALSKKLF